MGRPTPKSFRNQMAFPSLNVLFYFFSGTSHSSVLDSLLLITRTIFIYTTKEHEYVYEHELTHYRKQ